MVHVVLSEIGKFHYRLHYFAHTYTSVASYKCAAHNIAKLKCVYRLFAYIDDTQTDYMSEMCVCVCVHVVKTLSAMGSFTGLFIYVYINVSHLLHIYLRAHAYHYLHLKCKLFESDMFYSAISHTGCSTYVGPTIIDAQSIWLYGLIFLSFFALNTNSISLY